jgi:hypothetical protein
MDKNSSVWGSYLENNRWNWCAISSSWSSHLIQLQIEKKRQDRTQIKALNSFCKLSARCKSWTALTADAPLRTNPQENTRLAKTRHISETSESQRGEPQSRTVTAHINGNKMEQSCLAQAPLFIEVYIKASLRRKVGPIELEDVSHFCCLNYKKQQNYSYH